MMLELGDNETTDAGAAALAQALPGSQVTALELSGNQVTGPSPLAAAGAERPPCHHSVLTTSSLDDAIRFIR